MTHSMDCCIYLVDAGQLVLIDAGAGASTSRIIDNVHALSLMPEKLSHILVTHAHIDHVGSLYDLRSKYGARIVAHTLDAGAIETGKKVGAEYYGIKYHPCPVDIKLEGEENDVTIGDTKFRCLHIPGHTPGSIAIVVENGGKKILFGQDIHGPYLPMWGGEPKTAASSLQKLLELEVDILCEGHYGVIQPASEIRTFIGDFIRNLNTG